MFSKKLDPFEEVSSMMESPIVMIFKRKIGVIVPSDKKLPEKGWKEETFIPEDWDTDLEKLPEDKKLLVSEKKFNPSDLKGIKKELEKLEKIVLN